MVASKKNSKETESLRRLVDASRTTPSDVFQIMSSNSEFNFETVLNDGEKIDYHIDLSGIDMKKTKWSASDEANLAIAIYESLVPVREVSLEYIIDPGIWSWIGLTQIKDYVVNRWCDGYTHAGLPEKPSSCSYFLSGNSIQRHTRCAPRRLFIAADTSWRVEGDFSHTKTILENTDIYSATFERQLGNDPELAVEIATIFKGTKREVYRPGIKLVGILLSTVALEVLNRKEKRELVQEAFNAVKDGIVS